MSNDTNNTNEEGYSLISLVTILSVAAILAIAVLSVLAGNVNCVKNMPAKCNSAMTEVIGPCKITTSTARYTLCSGGQSNGKERCSDPQDYECVFILKIINIAKGIRIRCPNTPRTIQKTNIVSQTLAVGEDCGEEEGEE